MQVTRYNAAFAQEQLAILKFKAMIYSAAKIFVVIMIALQSVGLAYYFNKVDQLQSTITQQEMKIVSLELQRDELQRKLDSALVAESSVGDAVNNKIIQPVKSAAVSAASFIGGAAVSAYEGIRGVFKGE